jgi:hypothetical protein
MIRRPLCALRLNDALASRRSKRTLWALVLMASLSWTHLHAQAGPPERTVIAVPDAFPAIEARALIVRTPKEDVIVLRKESATPDALLMALGLLRRLRVEDSRPGSHQVIPITGFVVTREAAAERRQDAQAVLRRLRAAPSARLGDLGQGRWTVLRRQGSPGEPSGL